MEDLAKVKGIGKKTLEANREAIVIIDPARELRTNRTQRHLPTPS